MQRFSNSVPTLRKPCHRTQFGQLTFCCEARAELFPGAGLESNDSGGDLVQGLMEHGHAQPCVYPIYGKPMRLPQAVLQAGQAKMTAVVYRLASCAAYWDFPAGEVYWSSESGGAQALDKIRRCCRSLNEQYEGSHECRLLNRTDPELEVLLEPQRTLEAADDRCDATHARIGLCGCVAGA